MSTPKKLRSREWWGGSDYYSFARRAWVRSEGFNADVFEGKPVIGICNSWSELNNCNAHLRTVAEAVKRGVWAAGGFPLEFPTISLGETFLYPTSMYFRNLQAMETEEMLRGQPMDGVVLLAGCDKTVPAQLMAAASVDLPAIMVLAGPMLAGRYQGARLGAGHLGAGDLRLARGEDGERRHERGQNDHDDQRHRHRDALLVVHEVLGLHYSFLSLTRPCMTAWRLAGAAAASVVSSVRVVSLMSTE